MMPSPRPRSTRQALASLQFALGTVAPPNPFVFVWRWRWELVLGIGLPATLFLFGGLPAMLGTLTVIAGVISMALLWAPARGYLIARAWCVITPHRVRRGCAQAWIHSRRGKIPVILLTTPQPFGERVHLWCRAGTSDMDFINARPLLTAACWARDVRVSTSERFAQLIALDVIRRLPPDQRGDTDIGHLGRQGSGTRTPPDVTNRRGTPPTWPDRPDLGPAA
jgi:hypothetical protein